MIRYYSARRTQTVWSRAFDFAVLAALILALPTVWLFDSMVVRPTLAIELSGLLRRDGEAPLTAQVVTEESRPDQTGGKPVGNFQVRADDRYCGWPLTTSLRREVARVDIDVLAETGPRKNLKFAMDDPVVLAIERALANGEHDEALAAWKASGPTVWQRWGGWSGNAALWWIMLTLACGIAIWLARLGTNLTKVMMTSRRAQLRADGKCLECGYDMTGLEFNERCPECGKLVW